MEVVVPKQPLAIFGFPTEDRSERASFDNYLDALSTAMVDRAWNQEVLEMADLIPQTILRMGDRVEMPLDASNVALVTSAGKVTRVSYRIEGGQTKRYSKKYDEVLD